MRSPRVDFALLALAMALLAGCAWAGSIGGDIRSSFSDLGGEIANIYDKAASGSADVLQTTGVQTWCEFCIQTKQRSKGARTVATQWPLSAAAGLNRGCGSPAGKALYTVVHKAADVVDKASRHIQTAEQVLEVRAWQLSSAGPACCPL